MKTIITLALFLTVMGSCKKENRQTCWSCTYALVNGVQKPDSTICNDGEQPAQQYDINGMPVTQICTKQ